jgi:SAM-dependent methyltransferase
VTDPEAPSGDSRIPETTDSGGYIQQSSRVLDVGSGGGEWLYLLKRKGVAATGLDPDSAYAAFAKRELCVDVLSGTVSGAE